MTRPLPTAAENQVLKSLAAYGAELSSQPLRETPQDFHFLTWAEHFKTTFYHDLPGVAGAYAALDQFLDEVAFDDYYKQNGDKPVDWLTAEIPNDLAPQYTDWILSAETESEMRTRIWHSRRRQQAHFDLQNSQHWTAGLAAEIVNPFNFIPLSRALMAPGSFLKRTTRGMLEGGAIVGGDAVLGYAADPMEEVISANTLIRTASGALMVGGMTGFGTVLGKAVNFSVIGQTGNLTLKDFARSTTRWFQNRTTLKATKKDSKARKAAVDATYKEDLDSINKRYNDVSKEINEINERLGLGDLDEKAFDEAWKKGDRHTRKSLSALHRKGRQKADLIVQRANLEAEADAMLRNDNMAQVTSVAQVGSMRRVFAASGRFPWHTIHSRKTVLDDELPEIAAFFRDYTNGMAAAPGLVPMSDQIGPSVEFLARADANVQRWTLHNFTLEQFAKMRGVSKPSEMGEAGKGAARNQRDITLRPMGNAIRRGYAKLRGRDYIEPERRLSDLEQFQKDVVDHLMEESAAPHPVKEVQAVVDKFREITSHYGKIIRENELSMFQQQTKKRIEEILKEKQDETNPTKAEWLQREAEHLRARLTEYENTDNPYWFPVHLIYGKIIEDNDGFVDLLFKHFKNTQPRKRVRKAGKNDDVSIRARAIETDWFIRTRMTLDVDEDLAVMIAKIEDRILELGPDVQGGSRLAKERALYLEYRKKQYESRLEDPGDIGAVPELMMETAGLPAAMFKDFIETDMNAIIYRYTFDVRVRDEFNTRYGDPLGLAPLKEMEDELLRLKGGKPRTDDALERLGARSEINNPWSGRTQEVKSRTWKEILENPPEPMVSDRLLTALETGSPKTAHKIKELLRETMWLERRSDGQPYQMWYRGRAYADNDYNELVLNLFRREGKALRQWREKGEPSKHQEAIDKIREFSEPAVDALERQLKINQLFNIGLKDIGVQPGSAIRRELAANSQMLRRLITEVYNDVPVIWTPRGVLGVKGAVFSSRRALNRQGIVHMASHGGAPLRNSVTLAHEVGHALTIFRIKEDKALMADLSKVLIYAKREADRLYQAEKLARAKGEGTMPDRIFDHLDSGYWRSKPTEMVAELIGDPNVMRVMKMIPGMDKFIKGPKGLSLWDQTAHRINQIFPDQTIGRSLWTDMVKAMPLMSEGESAGYSGARLLSDVLDTAGQAAPPVRPTVPGAAVAGPGNPQIIAEMERQLRAAHQIRRQVLGWRPNPVTSKAEQFSYDGAHLLQLWNISTFMGSSGVSALVDPGILMAAFGGQRVFWGLREALGDAKFRSAVGLAQGRRMGAVHEVMSASRLYSLMGMDGRRGVGGKFGSWLEDTVRNLMIFNGLAPWTDLMAGFAAGLGQHQVLAISKKMTLGTMTDLDKQAAKWLGINQDYAYRVVREFEEKGDLLVNREVVPVSDGLKWWEDGFEGLTLNNMDDWEDALKLDFRAQVHAAVRNAVIHPGVAENPVGHSVYGDAGMKVFALYQKFGIGISHRIQMRGLEAQDTRALSGVAGMIALGFIVDEFRTPDYVNKSFDERLVDAFMMSGAAGVYGWLEDIVARASGDTIGLRSMLGQDPYASRDPNLATRAGAMGPIVQQWAQLFRAASGQADTKDTVKAMVDMVPYQNAWYWRKEVNRVEAGMVDFFED